MWAEFQRGGAEEGRAGGDHLAGHGDPEEVHQGLREGARGRAGKAEINEND